MRKKTTTILAVSALLLASVGVQAAVVSGQGTWEATLLARDLDGNASTIEAYYDTALGITWLADTNAAVGSAYDTLSPGTGLMEWVEANAWAASLNIGGVTGWRLPNTNPVDGTTADDANLSVIGTEDWGFNISAPGTAYAGSTASEMSYMYYNTLGLQGSCDPATSTVSSCVGSLSPGLSNTGPFSNLFDATITDNFWSATTYALAPNRAWILNFATGNQFQDVYGIPANYLRSWAVHDGDVGVAVSAVPAPAAIWLFGSGLVGLMGIARKKRALA